MPGTGLPEGSSCTRPTMASEMMRSSQVPVVLCGSSETGSEPLPACRQTLPSGHGGRAGACWQLASAATAKTPTNRLPSRARPRSMPSLTFMDRPMTYFATRLKLTARLAFWGLMTLAAAGPAAAADAPTGQRAAAFEALMACRGEADDARRLACYDAAAGRIGEAEKSGDIVVV